MFQHVSTVHVTFSFISLQFWHLVTWSLVTYLYKLHHRDWVEEVKAPKSVQSVGGAGYVRDAQGGCVAGKDGVSKIQSAEDYTVSNT